MKLKDIIQTGKNIAYGTLMATMLSPIQAFDGDSQKDIQKIKREVKAQHTGYYTTSTAPLDTVWVFQKGYKTIESGSDFISYKKEGDDKSSFLYDLWNDENIDRVIFTDGKVRRHERAMIDLTGLSGTSGLEVELDLNEMEQEMQGRTPYNTRKVYAVDHADSTVGVYDFGRNGYGELGPKAVIKLQDLYQRVIDESKKLLGLSE